MGDVLIRGGTVVDGTGAPARRADVRISGVTIADVGSDLQPADADERVIDAGGALVTPGFIDVHTHLDPSLFWDPLADPLPQHGITTVLTGNCSLSLVPIRPQDRNGMIRLFSYIEDFPEHALRDAVPWTWESWGQYRDAQSGGYAINSAGLVGHTALRVYVMGEAAWDRPADVAERQQIAAYLEEALRSGAFGLSTSFFDEDPDSRPVPSRLADDEEFRALFDVLARYRGLLQFVPCWLGDPLESIERMATLASGRDITVSWTGMVHDARREAQMLHMLDRTSELAAGLNLRLNAQYS